MAAIAGRFVHMSTTPTEVHGALTEFMAQHGYHIFACLERYSI